MNPWGTVSNRSGAEGREHLGAGRKRKHEGNRRQEHIGENKTTGAQGETSTAASAARGSVKSQANSSRPPWPSGGHR